MRLVAATVVKGGGLVRIGEQTPPTGQGTSPTPSQPQPSAQAQAQPPAQPQQSQPATQSSSRYQEIFDEYAAKIRTAAPNVSITELAQIANEGISKMAEYLLSARGTDGQYVTYEGWAKKLMDVYLNEVR